MSNVGKVVLPRGTLIFEPYSTLVENFIHWFKPYMSQVFKTQTRRNIKDTKLHQTLIKKFNSKNELKEMQDIINELAKNGFKGPKTYFTPNVKLYEFIKYDEDVHTLNDINSDLFEDFLISPEIENYSYTYKKNIYVAIKNFLNFIEERNVKINENGEYLEHNFKLRKNIIRVIGKEKKKLAYLSPYDEFYKFLDAINVVPWKSNSKNRNTLMLKFLLITGIRVSELTSIKLNDLELNKDDNSLHIKIIGKGNKKRLVSIALNLIDKELEKCIIESKERNRSEYLFSTKTGKAINDRYLNTLVENTLDVAGIKTKEKKGPHLLRHSCATWLIVIAGFDIAKLQIYMGHEDINTTKKYVHLDDEVVKEMSRKANEILGENYSSLIQQ